MPEDRKFKNYMFYGGSTQQLETLHNLVVQYKHALFENHILQNVLLNSGYQIENRPTSFFDLEDAVWPRSHVKANLIFLEYVIDRATKPEITIVETTLGKIIPASEYEGEELSFVTAEGFDAIGIERLQEEWFANPDITDVIRQFQAALTKSFNEFNQKYVLSCMLDATKSFLDLGWKEEQGYQNKIKGVLNAKTFIAFDTAYFNTARMDASAAGGPYQKLAESEFGKLFLLEEKQMSEMVVVIRKGCSYID
ncbi:hypothetical protein H8D36_02545 [archaeon]|nr:hypothetical protein [archaeon]MBL7057562.1 hypothetical protein [Candidatus Woesearchaeota archaeon]